MAKAQLALIITTGRLGHGASKLHKPYICRNVTLEQDLLFREEQKEGSHAEWE